MSYSLQTPCFGCKKKKGCGDGEILQGAVNTIHQLGPDRGHLGGGSIVLDCSYGFEGIGEACEDCDNAEAAVV